MKISSKDLSRFEYLSLQFKKKFKGELPSQRVSSELGSGLEFVEHRNYFPGDDHRNIDWNIFARLGDLMVKRYREDRNLPVSILLDCSKSMSGSKFDTAREVTAALCYLVFKHFDAVSIHPFANQPMQSLSKLRGKNQIVNAISFLESLEPLGDNSDLFTASMSLVQQPQHVGPVFVISDFLLDETTQLQASLELLKFHHYDPFVLQLNEPLPKELEQTGQFELIDRESGRSIQTTIDSQILKQVESKQLAHAKSIQNYCQRNRMSYLFAQPDWTYEQIVLKIIST